MNLLEMNPHETRFIPLIGSPIGGSTASFLYNKIFAECGINAMSYPVEVKKGELPEFLAAVKFMNSPGCILTSPHKQDIIQYIDDVDDASRVFRSVNAVRFYEDGHTEGHGMDGTGVIGAFDDNGVDLKGKEVVMLGAGGISGIFASELANRGIRKLTILNRTAEKAQYVAETLAARTSVETAYNTYTPEHARQAVETADILIQATTLGMKGSGQDHPDLSFMEVLPSTAWVMEAVSNPPETSVIKKAKELNLRTVLGMEMLVNQVKALCKFLLDWDAPDEAKQIGIDFYCSLFQYKR
ncbi:MAG: shikimate dehydrogenase [Oscillospiraceae bacterium]|nr:shikimate dehydrogenase [Oscillospiraceae bacterium]